MKDNRSLFSPCRFPARLPPLHPRQSPTSYSLRDTIGNLCLRLRKNNLTRERKRIFRRFTFTEEEIFRSKLTPPTIPLSSGFVSNWHFYPTPRTKLISGRRLSSRIYQRI